LVVVGIKGDGAFAEPDGLKFKSLTTEDHREGEGFDEQKIYSYNADA
jgi:hypothetical protein